MSVVSGTVSWGVLPVGTPLYFPPNGAVSDAMSISRSVSAGTSKLTAFQSPAQWSASTISGTGAVAGWGGDAGNAISLAKVIATGAPATWSIVEHCGSQTVWTVFLAATQLDGGMSQGAIQLTPASVTGSPIKLGSPPKRPEFSPGGAGQPWSIAVTPDAKSVVVSIGQLRNAPVAYVQFLVSGGGVKSLDVSTPAGVTPGGIGPRPERSMPLQMRAVILW